MIFEPAVQPTDKGKLFQPPKGGGQQKGKEKAAIPDDCAGKRYHSAYDEQAGEGEEKTECKEGLTAGRMAPAPKK